jgi:hypothetical protein
VDRSEAEQSRAQRTARTPKCRGNGAPRPYRARTTKVVTRNSYACQTPSIMLSSMPGVRYVSAAPVQCRSGDLWKACLRGGRAALVRAGSQQPHAAVYCACTLSSTAPRRQAAALAATRINCGFPRRGWCAGARVDGTGSSTADVAAARRHRIRRQQRCGGTPCERCKPTATTANDDDDDAVAGADSALYKEGWQQGTQPRRHRRAPRRRHRCIVLGRVTAEHTAL